MSDKASSDLDIFDGLATKKSRPAPPGIPNVTAGSRVPPPPSMTRQKTLLGLTAPPGTIIPGLTSRPPGAPPPPPPSLRSAAPPPPTPSKAISAPPPPPPPPVMGASTALMTPMPPPPPAPLASMSALPPPAPPPPALQSKQPVDEETTPAPAVRVSADAGSSNGTAKAGVDIDWDDEDEATQVFDRTQEDAIRSLLRSAPPPPPPPAAGAPAVRSAGPPMPGPTLPRSPVPAPRSTLSAPPPPSLPRGPLPPPPRAATTSSLPAPPAPLPLNPAHATTHSSQTFGTFSDTSPFERTGRRPIVYAAAAGLALLVVVGVVALLPRDGSLVVTVAGAGNKSVSDLEVLVDGKKVCSSSPCQVKELGSGTHLVKVNAPGYQSTADQAVKVASGDEAVLNVSLSRGGSGTGLNVRAEGSGLKLFVDGKELGPLPQSITDIAPGEHVVKIDGGDRYEPFEQTVTLSADQAQTLEPKLKVKKGLATIKPGLNAEGAHVVLVSGNERRPVPQLPLAVEVPVDKPYSIVATKRGFQDFEQRLEFEDNKAERTFVIDMVPPLSNDSGRAAPAPASRAPAPASKAPAAAPAVAAPAAAKPAAAGGTLNLNSIPVSNVILDGKPLGPTPKLGVSVTPGNHTVIFVHPEHGRKAKSVSVAAGKTVPVVVKF